MQKPSSVWTTQLQDGDIAHSSFIFALPDTLLEVLAMKIPFSIAALVLSFSTSGCAINPLPEDYLGVPTLHIVKQIRCETRQAIIDSALGWLSSLDDYPHAKNIGYEFEAKIRPIQTFKPSLFHKEPDVERIVQIFYDTGIASNYSLESTEINNIDAELNFLKLFPSSRGTASLKGGLDRQRQGTSTFTVTDTFSYLINKLPDKYCKDQLVAANFIYPITGKVGMEKIVQDFINLTLFGSLSGGEKTPKGPPTYVRDLEFQTTLTATVNPKVTFSPVAGVSDAAFTGVATRKEVHTVTTGFAIDTKAAVGIDTLRSTLFGPLLTANGSPIEMAAAVAVNQALTRKALKTNVTIIQ